MNILNWQYGVRFAVVGHTVAGVDAAFVVILWLASTSPCLLAWVSVAQALNRHYWRSYTGINDWSTDWRRSKPVFDHHPPLNVHWNEYLGRYVVATSFLSHRIQIDPAERLEGPWSTEPITVEGVAPTSGPRWIQSAVMHPEWAQEAGRFEILTSVRNVDNFFSLKTEMRVVELEFRRKGLARPTPRQPPWPWKLRL